MISNVLYLVLSFHLLVFSSEAFLAEPVPRSATRQQSTALSSSIDYLSSLSQNGGSAIGTVATPILQQSPVRSSTYPASSPESTVTGFSHAPFSYFTVDKMTLKGPRKNADVGQPYDATRPLVRATTSVGTWWCAEGGWPSPAQRTTTEIFYVFAGHGCLTDEDGKKNFFGPGDTVILPKGWSGRWDVLEDIHKVWIVHDHPKIEETSNPIRAIVTHYSSLTPAELTPQGLQAHSLHGTSPNTALRTIYNVGPTAVGYRTITPGSFTASRSTTESFHLLEGVCVLTNADGSAQRCVAGDTIQLPAGWTGTYDIIETIKKLWVVTPQ